jgi:hypothetical protein
MATREFPNAPILYDDVTGQVVGFKHSNGNKLHAKGGNAWA